MKRILLVCLTAVFAFASSELWAQERTVTGRVTSAEDGSGLPGVNVVLKGTTNGTVTTVDGDYSINVPAAGGTLVFSFIGLQSQEIEVGSRNKIDVPMSQDVTQLSEVVITGAMGLQKQAKELGYAASTISNKDITMAKAVDVAQSLNGKISGVNITTTNSSVFQNSKINIRGIRSLTGNNQPMLVVDGAQVPLSLLYSISPEDIADMTVLKSGASAALYGPDAVNGVMVVTTKRGRPNQAPIVSVTSSYQLSRVAYFPKLQHEFGAGAGEVIDQYGNYGYVPYENQLYGPRFDGSMQDIGVPVEDGEVQRGPYSNLHKNDKKNFWNTGSIFQNSVSLTGSDYFLSVQDANIKGLMPQDKNRRTTIRFNGDKKINKFSVSYGLGYTLQNSDVVNENQLQNLYQGSYSGSIMFAVMQTPDNVPLLSYKDQTSKWAQYGNYYNEFAISPYWIINNMRSKSKSNNLIGNATLGYEIAPWLKATARFNATVNDVRTDNTQNPLDPGDWAVKNRNSTTYFRAKGAVFNDNAYATLLNVDYFLNGKTNITNSLSVNYLVGGNYRQTNEKDVAVGGNNLVVPGLYNVSVRSGDANLPGYQFGTLIPYNNGTDYNYNLLTKRASAYGTVGFGFKEWAFLDLTGRNDWDSRLNRAHRSNFYPSANLSVVLSDAITALKESPVSYLKLRAAYSKSANVNVGPYSLYPTYTQPAGFPFGSNVGFTAGPTIPSPNLKPETVLNKELGLEIGLLNGKFDVEATYFDQQCNDQILQTSLPSSTGYTVGRENAASFYNRGVELDLGIAPYKIGKGGLAFKINATYNTNKITATADGSPVVIGGTSNYIQISRSSPTANNIAVVGGPAYQFQLSDYVRDPETGKVIVDKVKGNPSQSPDLIVTGRSLPLWIVGFTPTYTIGGLSVSMTWDYKGGHQFYSGLGSDMDFAGISKRSASYGRQRFVMPNSVYMGDDGKYVNNTNLQVQDGNYGFWTGSTTNTAIATNYYASAAAFRLREVNITYNLPQKWMASTKYIRKASLSLIGRNLLLLVPKSNQWGDPEFNYSSAGNTYGLGSAFQTPASRMYGASLNLTL
ncbi:MAG TPA: SusC/RagA family TonB-linked outer membrane protein [Ohtaekwangia sp.]|uniref:SusC/RagA family TonB-linked outer membrane protein n=2 Tax=Ohtaekwangia sp. TaxID=2066019 RepID=UPI002F945FA7